MQNITLIALYLSTFYSSSPLFMINQNNHKTNTLISNSHFSYLMSNVIYASTSYHSTTITNNIFSNSLDTPLNFANNEEKNWEGKCRKGSQCCMSKDYDFQKDKIIENVNVTDKSFPDGFMYFHSYFNDGCGDIKISKCNFIHCNTISENGGGIVVQQYCTVILHNCIFDSCHSSKNGGAGAIAKEIRFKNEIKNGVVVNDDPDHIKTKRLDIQYTCFQNCYTTGGNGYGTALLMGAESITFYYASTVDCPPSNSAIPKGAQFDILADSVSSQFINVTGGKSIYCGAMEYREATSGFFQFQTIAKLDCKYAISFTSVSIEGLAITSSNVFENSVKRPSNEDYRSNPPALIFVRTNDCKVENFYFSRNNLNNVGLFTAKENDDKLTITLINCYADTSNQNYWSTTYVNTINCNFTNAPIQTYPLRQLNLGHCKGDMPPGDMIITSIFTPSSVFTPSSAYTKSNIFSHSNQFSKSNDFTNSNEFTDSGKFSSTDYFTRSNDFTGSGKFTKSKQFSNSNEFTESKPFSKTEGFTGSNQFTQSSKFTKSNEFTQSSCFTQSNEFNPTRKFSPSSVFSGSDVFNPSPSFTGSNAFTKSDTFTDSDVFTQSNEFNPTSTFSPSSVFSGSDVFSPSSSFTGSNAFTKSDTFTDSDVFTRSNTFSASFEFSSSNQFTSSQVIPFIGGGKNSDESNKTTIIAAVASSIGGAAVIGGLVGFFFIKKHIPQIENVDKVKETNTTTTIDNDLQTLMDQDDPFDEDFL